MRRQNGHIYKENGVWLGKWREYAIVDGRKVSKQCARKLADYSDRYRCESDVRPILDDILRPINARTSTPESTLTVAQYGEEYWLPWTEENCKPSTVNGYKRFWEAYLSPRLQDVTLRDFRTVDAANILDALHRSTACGRTMLKHAKSILSGIFTLARNKGVLSSPNPIQGTMIPRKAATPHETHAATMDEVATILNAVEKQEVKDMEITREMRLKVKAAIALQFFAGLRPGEARGVRWEDYSGKRLAVCQSVWRTFETAPKTESSAKPVPVIEPLRTILADLREADGNPSSGPILRGPKTDKTGKPLNLDNLSKRILSPILKAAEIDWYGWYALRRGASTTLTSLSRDSGMASMGLLRHSSIATTQAHYIKDVPENTLAAMERLEAMFSECSAVKQ